MELRLHKQATTTPRIPSEIQQAPASVSNPELAAQPDNGKAFADRLSRGGNHPVDRYCNQQGIEHRLIAPGPPRTNGMVERFNGRISDVLATRRYDSSEYLETTLKRYNWLYSHQIPQRALNHHPPIQAMKQ